MNNRHLVPRIEELGLSNKEASVYIACLQLGPASVQNIAVQAGIKRVTTYVVLESLVALGLVTQAVRGKKTLFVAEEPVRLQRLLQKRELELKRQQHSFTQVLDDLQSLRSLPRDSPDVKFYDSTAGIKTILNAFLQQERGPQVDTVYGFSNLDLLLNYVPEFRAEMATQWRRKTGLKSRFLYTAEAGPLLKSVSDGTYHQSRWLPRDMFPMTGDFTIAGDNILMLSLGAANPIGLAVRSDALAAGLRALFSVAWEAAGPVN